MPSWLNLPQAEIAKTIWTFASQLSLFSLTIIAASYAWSRESNYKLKSEAARECLVSFYTLADAVKEMGNSSLYIAPSDTDHSHERAARIAMAHQRVEGMWIAYRKYRLQLRLAAFYIDLKNVVPRDPAPTNDAFQEELQDAARYAMVVAGFKDEADAGADADELRYSRQALASLNRDDENKQGRISVLRSTLEKALLPSTKPRGLLGSF